MFVFIIIDRNCWAGGKFSTNIEVKVEKRLFETIYPDMVSSYEQASIKKKATSSKYMFVCSVWVLSHMYRSYGDSSFHW